MSMTTKSCPIIRIKILKVLFDLAKSEGNNAIRICATIEQEIALLPEKDKKFF
ncbi:MAG: hypothetical protein Ct9H300mP2_1300 [Candidatus Neomarinimicrobiota bacterium]|nr:MAG: hypothetical protein Ct9H300mP2_1300 [Candidatus Neomarinimicrobiota bacterium]